MKAKTSDLATILRVYEGRRMPLLSIPCAHFDSAPAKGASVTVEGGGTSCEGEVVGFVVLVALDPETQPTISAEQMGLA